MEVKTMKTMNNRKGQLLSLIGGVVVVIVVIVVLFRVL
jgi:hypothetical protein